MAVGPAVYHEQSQITRFPFTLALAMAKDRQRVTPADPPMVTVLLADHHAVVRLGVRRLLEKEPDFRIVGEVGDGLKVISEIERLQPDVLVLGLVMPGLGGLEVLRRVKRR